MQITRPIRMTLAALAVALILAIAIPVQAEEGAGDAYPLTAEGAAAFVEAANAELSDLSERAARAAWVQANFITEDTTILSAQATEVILARAVELAKQAARYNDVEGMDPLVARQIQVMQRGFAMPAPADPN